MSSLTDYLFKEHPPAVTSVFCTSLFALYLLGNAAYYQFESAPDHSMPSDYNRLLHNLSYPELCQSASTPLDTTKWSSVALLTKIHGSESVVHKDAILNFFINSTYYVQTDALWQHAACEKGKCKVEKCAKVWAPTEFFPDYELDHANQCEQLVTENPKMYSMSSCPAGESGDAKFEFKRRNEYAKPLSYDKKKVMQYRVVEVALSLLFFNFLLVVASILCGKYYRRFSLE